MKDSLNMYIATESMTIVQAMQKIDQGAKGVLFVVDEDEKLIGCVTDGDIRRWLIRTADLTAKVAEFMFRMPRYLNETDHIDAQQFMRENSINSLPVVDKHKRIINIVFQKQLYHPEEEARFDVLADAAVVIMAGGKGTRLYPYTKILPKPLIPIGEIPIIERIMNCFIKFGVKNFWLTVNYKKGMIKSYFDELEPDYRIIYVEEDKPLGTGGSLKLIEQKFEKPIIVTNCDVLIEANFADIYEHHVNSGNEITIVSSLKNIVVPYGVLEVEKEGIIQGLHEKPSFSYFVNTGMYVLNPKLIDFIPKDTFYHMPQLVDACISKGMRVGMYPISEDAFLDMGEFEEMKKMEEKLRV